MEQKKVDLVSVEHLDEAITVVGIKGWVFLTGSLFLFVPIILWAFLGTVPIAVTGKCLFFDPSNTSRPENLEIYGFLPFFAASSIEPGMKVECTLDGIDVERFGMLEGVVKTVVPYPVDLTEEHMKQIPSKSLSEYLLNSSASVPSILVIAYPLHDSSLFQSGMTGTITITLSRERPISYVIPSLSSRSGTK